MPPSDRPAPPDPAPPDPAPPDPAPPRPAEPGPPPHRRVAAALSHDRSAAAAPRVTAIGRGALAEAILELAYARGVKVREDADLAALLATVELQDTIPLEAFAAVAEILAQLYRLNGGSLADCGFPASGEGAGDAAPR